ncbi:hypothetical protein MMPV_009003 [Pyropia vietnamensis]
MAANGCAGGCAAARPPPPSAAPSLRRLGALVLLVAATFTGVATVPTGAAAVESDYERWGSSHGHADGNARPPDGVRHDMEELMHDMEEVRKAGGDADAKVDLEASINMLDAKFAHLRRSLSGAAGGDDNHAAVVSAVRADEAQTLAHDLKGMMAHSAGAIGSLEEGVTAMERSLGEVTSLQKRYHEDMVQINHMADSARTVLERMQRSTLRDRGSAARAAASMKQLTVTGLPSATAHSKLLTIVLLEVVALVVLALVKRYQAGKQAASAKRNW